MQKRDYFIKAIQNEAYKNRDWVLSIFSVSMENPDDWAKNPYPYRLMYKEDGLYFIDLETNGNHIRLEGYVENEPLFSVKDPITLEKGELVNVLSKTDTRIGNVIFNAIAIIWPFGDKIPFQVGRVNGNKLNALIVSKLKDNPDPSKGEISVEELLKYGEAMGALGGFTQICVPAASPKSLTINPTILKRRDELLEKHKDELDDPVVIAAIEKELVAMDRKDFQGDLAEGFLIGKKAFETTRKKLYIMEGLEGGFGDAKSMTLIQKGLREGWDIDNLPAMADSMRYASYNRGALTALGGESVKYFHRVFQNTKIAEDDCGDTVGIDWEFGDDAVEAFQGLYQIVGTKSVALTPDIIKGLIGKTVRVRSPMTCKTAAPSFCAKCMGDNLARTPTSLLINASDVGSRFMTTFLSLAHGGTLKTTPMDLKEVLT